MSKKALLVNDSKFESLVLRDMLNGLDYDVELADEYDALYEINQFAPDIVIVNYIMQEIRGDKLVQIIKAGNPGIKCLLSSSNLMKTSDFTNTKIDGILRTPVSLFTVKDILSSIGALDDEDVEGDANKCKSCNKDVSAFSGIVFCPYCGNKL